MKVLTTIDTPKLIQVNPYQQKFVCLISIMEAYLNMISTEHLKNSLELDSIDKVTLRKLALIYNHTIKNNSGRHGVCWEYSIYYAIYYNDEYIQDLLNNAINCLSGEYSYDRIEAILWGGEKKSQMDTLENSLSDEDVLWTSAGCMPLKKYIYMMDTAFKHKGKNNPLPKQISGLWKTDLFVKKECSNIWYSVTIKWNKSDIKHAPGLSIGISLDSAIKTKKSENPKLVSNNFVYCHIPSIYNFGEYFLWMYRFFENALQNILENNIKNSIRFSFPSTEELTIFKFLYEYRDLPILYLLDVMKKNFDYPNIFTYKESEILLLSSTDDEKSAPISKKEAPTGMLLLPTNYIV